MIHPYFSMCRGQATWDSYGLIVNAPWKSWQHAELYFLIKGRCGQCIYLSIYLSFYLSNYWYLYVHIYIYICVYVCVNPCESGLMIPIRVLGSSNPTWRQNTWAFLSRYEPVNFAKFSQWMCFPRIVNDLYQVIFHI